MWHLEIEKQESLDSVLEKKMLIFVITINENKIKSSPWQYIVSNQSCLLKLYFYTTNSICFSIAKTRKPLGNSKIVTFSLISLLTLKHDEYFCSCVGNTKHFVKDQERLWLIVEYWKSQQWHLTGHIPFFNLSPDPEAKVQGFVK